MAKTKSSSGKEASQPLLPAAAAKPACEPARGQEDRAEAVAKSTKGQASVLVDIQALAPELAEAQLREGVQRWWIAAQREGRAEPPPDQAPELTAEETERLRQLALVRRATSPDGAS